MTAETGYGGAAVEFKCNSWKCEHCAPYRRASVIRQGANGDPNRFITLTSHRRPGYTPEQAARNLVQANRTFLRLVRKRYPNTPVECFYVFEATKAGWPHLHILMRGPFISQKWLSALMARLNGSPVVDIRRIDNVKRMGAYVAKYLGKDVHKFGTLKRYWQTKSYQTEEQKVFERQFPTDLVWERRDLPFSVILSDWTRSRLPVRLLAPGVAMWGTFSNSHLARAAVGWAIRASPETG